MVFLGVLVKTPFKQFNKAKGKDGYLSKHGSLQYHHDAIVATKVTFLKNFNQPNHRIENIIEKKRKDLNKISTFYVPLLSVLSFVACMIFPFNAIGMTALHSLLKTGETSWH